MPAPSVHATTRRIYDRLPEMYRNADAVQYQPDYPLLRFLSLIGDQLGEVEDLVDRINYVSTNDQGDPDDTSDLADPDAADASWLPWLAQVVGVDDSNNFTEAGQRDAIRYVSSGWRAGTRTGMADAARTALTGSKFVRIVEHYTGDSWKIEVRTRTTETPTPTAATDAIVAKNSKPVGVELVATNYNATWDEIETAFPTWSDLEAVGIWANVEEAGLL